MRRRPVPTMFDLLESLGFKFSGGLVRVPPGMRGLFNLLSPFIPTMKAEVDRRAKVKQLQKPVERVISAEKITSRHCWELEAYCNAHVVMEQAKAEGMPAGSEEVAREGFLCGFMLAVDLVADAYGVDLEQVPEKN